MPRGSRNKSHRQNKNSSKEYSDFDEDVKMKERIDNNDCKENGGSVKVSKDSLVSGEKRKIGKDLSASHANGNVPEEYAMPSKRRKEKIHGGSDRWTGDGVEEKDEVVYIDDKKLKSKDLLEVVGTLKSKTSRKHDVDSACIVVAEKDESKSRGNRGEKRSDKESGRKEGRQFKENKEQKDKDRGSERERKIHDGKHEAEVLPKQVEDHPSKRGSEHNEWPIEESRNIELEKELEKRIRRRGEGYSDKDRHQDDVKEGDERTLSTKSGRAKNIKHKDEVYGHREDKCREDGERVSKSRDVKYRGDSEHDNKHTDDETDRREGKYREDGYKDNKHKVDKYHDDDDYRDYRHKDERYREDVDRDRRHRNSRTRDDTDREKRARDHKHLKDDSDVADLSHGQTNNRGGSPIYDDRVARHKDNKDRRRDNDKDELTDYRSRSFKDQHSESEKRLMSDAKVEGISESGRPSSRDDVEITANYSRHRSFSSSKFKSSKDHHRVSKQDETKYRDYVHEERDCRNVNSSRDLTSAPGQSDKITQKDDNSVDDLSASNERRHLNRLDVRRNLDVEELGQRSGGFKEDAKEYLDKDGKESRKLTMENDLSQVDADNLSVSSPYTRNVHFSGNHKSLLPPQPPFRPGLDSPLGFGSSEDDRGKSSNRHWRSGGDPNIGRAPNNWKNIPNWPSPLANGGYIPFPHVPPPMFNPLLQQFVPPIFGRPPMNMNHAGFPFHVPDGDGFSGHGHPLAWRNPVEESIPPHLHGWEANSAIFGDGSHGYGRRDWDHGRTQLNNQMWESNADMWKGQDAGVSVDMQLAAQKNDQPAHRPTDETWLGQADEHIENEQCQSDIQVEATQKTPEVAKDPPVSVDAKEDDTLISRAYLSKIDISADLTEPELYDQCRSMLDLDQASVSDELDCKILFLEDGQEAGISNGASLFAAVDDSIFKEAMSLYTKQKVEFSAKIEENDDGKVSKEAGMKKVDMDDGVNEDMKVEEKMEMEVEVDEVEELIECERVVMNLHDDSSPESTH